MRNRQGYFVSKNGMRECTGCGIIFPQTSKMTLCNSCNSSRVKGMPPEWKMLQRAKQRAKFSGIEFNIELSDICIPNVCPILGIPLVVNKGKSGAFKDSPSLDRKDNSLGYVKGNVWVISQLANQMKGAASIEDLQKFALWVLSQFPRQEVTNPVEHN